VRMKMILKYFCLLLAEFELPLPILEQLCTDPLLLRALVERSQNPQVRDYFLNRFEQENGSTLMALRQRVDALLVSEGVRLSLSASSAPDFASLQDRGAVLLINTAGPNISRSVSEVLQGLILSDITQSVFHRTYPARPFWWAFDEAQNLFRNQANREHMVNLLTMSRSFGSFFLMLTQSLTSAVRDQDVINAILANVRWVVMLRATLRDAELIASAIPVTGRVPKPKHNPFEPTKFMTETEEVKATLKEITRLPDRRAYCWLKASLDTAVKMMTPYVPQPHEVAGCTERELTDFMQSTPLNRGMRRQEAIASIEQQQRRLRELLRPQPVVVASRESMRETGNTGGRTLVEALEKEYGKKRGGTGRKR